MLKFIVIVLVVFYFIQKIRLIKVIKMFSLGNVIVCGLRGRGKDMLMANIIARKEKKCYISNFDYKIKRKQYIPLDFSKLFVGNDYRNFISNEFNKYVYPYPENVDIYVSDIGNIFPNAFHSQIQKQYIDFLSYPMLSRHLGNNNFHCNIQNMNKLWDKLREQSDLYIMCMSCTVLFKKIVIQKIRLYDNYNSCINRVEPFKSPFKLIGSKKIDIKLEKQRHRNQYGIIKKYTLIYFNRSNYDTRYFKKVLENGK